MITNLGLRFLDFIEDDSLFPKSPMDVEKLDKELAIIWNILKENGYLVYVHPSGWRDIDGKFKSIQKEILSRNLMYLEIHNEKDGQRTFGAISKYPGMYSIRIVQERFLSKITGS